MSDRLRKALEIVAEEREMADGGETLWWCSLHRSPFNDHEGACIEWLAAPDDDDCTRIERFLCP